MRDAFAVSIDEQLTIAARTGLPLDKYENTINQHR